MNKLKKVTQEVRAAIQESGYLPIDFDRLLVPTAIEWGIVGQVRVEQMGSGEKVETCHLNSLVTCTRSVGDGGIKDVYRVEYALYATDTDGDFTTRFLRLKPQNPRMADYAVEMGIEDGLVTVATQISDATRLPSLIHVLLERIAPHNSEDVNRIIRSAG